MRDTIADYEKHLVKEPVANWDSLQRQMKAAEVDVVVASAATNVTWLSDFWSLSQWTRRSAQAFAVAPLSAAREVVVVTSLGNADLLQLEGPAAPTTVEPYGSFAYTAGDQAVDELDPLGRWLVEASRGVDGRSPIAALEAAIRRYVASGARIAVDTGGLLDGDWTHLTAALDAIDLIPGDDLLRRARTLKTQNEVARLESAAQITEASIETVFSTGSTGDTEADLQRRYLAAIGQRGSQPIFQAIVAGPRTALPNGQAGPQQLQPGDLVRFDGGCRSYWFAADIARTAVVEEPTDKQATYYAAVVAGLDSAIDIAGPGVPCRAIFETAVKAVRSNGIPHYERSHCGHGIGIENYDFPRIALTSNEILEPGMVICLETPYYELGWGGVQVEDTFVVTEDGLERFTTVPDSLLPIGDDAWSSTKNGE